MKHLVLTSGLCLILAGCATAPVRPLASAEKARFLVKNKITVNESTRDDVTGLLGEPDIRSVDEGSSLSLPRIPFFDERDVIGGVVPHETWTYIFGKGSGRAAAGGAVRIMGVNVIGKDIKTITIVFNKEGRVLGYQMIGHYVK